MEGGTIDTLPYHSGTLANLVFNGNTLVPGIVNSVFSFRFCHAQV